MRSSKKNCYFGINTRFEYLDEETIKLGKANFRFVLLGYEAADDETLQKLNKGYQLQHVDNCLKWLTVWDAPTSYNYGGLLLANKRTVR